VGQLGREEADDFFTYLADSSPFLYHLSTLSVLFPDNLELMSVMPERGRKSL
jgi:hypothetical protein